MPRIYSQDFECGDISEDEEDLSEIVYYPDVQDLIKDLEDRNRRMMMRNKIMKILSPYLQKA